ncbi:MAG: phenylalanine--tRNA ligase subunit beta [Oleiphilaceae bacterium]|nr:phenylalanine--tRNA ligase subunit beta [Oleiphilaceae bacterium]
MKFSEQWLRQWVNPTIGSEELVERITMAGLEVDGIEPVAGQFTQVVVGQVDSVEPHPDADKLRVCQVSDGQETVTVVCGAPNVRPGMKAPFARVGAQLPGGMQVRKARLRGVASFGMLCGADELGLAEDSDGLMELPGEATPGQDLREALNLDDRIIDVDLTPNRGDCFSLRGLARELGALTDTPFADLKPRPVPVTYPEVPDIRVDAPQACPRYIGRIIHNVDMSAESPLWLQERLRRSGIRAIDPVVDVTNYVMLETGQPLHAFDYHRIHQGIVVRMAQEGESLTLLDGQSVTLSGETLVIADHQGPLAMAGIMGGEGSGVGPETRDILLESAFFDPITIAGKARSHGLHTDSSHRFERGVDWQLQRMAAERASELLLSIVGGQAGEMVEVVSKADLPAQQWVELREARIAQVLGMAIPRARIEEILSRLDLDIEKDHGTRWLIRVPSHRFDIAIEVDLIEEIARVYGYNQLPVTQPSFQQTLRPSPEARRPLSRLRDHLVSLDFQEAITYSFVDPALQRLVEPDEQAVALANPIASDMAEMRTSLWPGLLKTLSHNQKRQQSRVRLFETGLRFRRGGVDSEVEDIQQTPMVAGLVSGPRQPENWVNDKSPLDFYDLKGDLETLAVTLGVRLCFRAERHPALHPGQSARILLGEQPVGWIGALHPGVQKKLELNGAIYLFELCLKPVLTGQVPHFREFSKFPEVRRDLAVIVSRDQPWSAIESVVRSAAGEHLTGLRVFDVYQGEHISDDQKSVAMSLFWQHPERTLQDDEVQTLSDAVVAQLQSQLDAILRS